MMKVGRSIERLTCTELRRVKVVEEMVRSYEKVDEFNNH